MSNTENKGSSKSEPCIEMRDIIKCLPSALRRHTLKAEIKVLQEASMGFEIEEMIKSLKAELKRS